MRAEGKQMSSKGALAAVFVANFLLVAGADAEPQAGAEHRGGTAFGPVGTLPAPQARALPSRVPLLRTNELRADPRWPQLKGCIDNTATPEAFRACLQNVFGEEITGRPRR